LAAGLGKLNRSPRKEEKRGKQIKEKRKEKEGKGGGNCPPTLGFQNCVLMVADRSKTR